MSLFDKVGELLGEAGDNASVPQALVAALGDQEGGLGGLIQKFEAGGLGDVIGSWVGTGENQPVSPDALQGVLDSGFVQQIAAKTGLPIEQLMPLIAQHLPQLIGHLTPNGDLPSGGGLLTMGLSFLENRIGRPAAS